jgi:hypothetical protein
VIKRKKLRTVKNVLTFIRHNTNNNNNSNNNNNNNNNNKRKIRRLFKISAIPRAFIFYILGRSW